MKVTFAELTELAKQTSIENGTGLTGFLQSVLESNLAEIELKLVQDLSHISQAANYVGGMTVNSVTHLKDNLYRCDYAYNWDIGWTCSGTQEAGRVNEKVRFTLSDSGEIEFRLLKLD